MQQDLKTLGYLPATAAIDGVYGAATRAAIVAWRQDQHEPATGFLEDADAAALEQQAAATNGAPAAAQVVSPSNAGATQANGPVNRIATAFVEDYWAHWSANNADALPYLEKVYAGRVRFYGGAISRDALMRIKRQFAEKWPERDYTMAADSLSTNCDATSAVCRVRGVVHWDAKNPAKNIGSTGDANFTFTLALSGGNALIQEESGSVVSRHSGAAGGPTPDKGMDSVAGNARAQGAQTEAKAAVGVPQLLPGGLDTSQPMIVQRPVLACTTSGWLSLATVDPTEASQFSTCGQLPAGTRVMPGPGKPIAVVDGPPDAPGGWFASHQVNVISPQGQPIWTWANGLANAPSPMQVPDVTNIFCNEVIGSTQEALVPIVAAQIQYMQRHYPDLTAGWGSLTQMPTAEGIQQSKGLGAFVRTKCSESGERDTPLSAVLDSAAKLIQNGQLEAWLQQHTATPSVPPQLSASGTDEPLKIPPEESGDYGDLCRTKWAKAGVLNSQMYSYCLQQEDEGYHQLINRSQDYAGMPNAQGLMDHLVEQWTRYGSRDDNMVQFQFSQEISDYKDMKWLSSSPGFDSAGAQQCAAEYSSENPEFQNWSMIDFCYRHLPNFKLPPASSVKE